MPKVKFYAVRRGREGRRIYTTWDECQGATDRWPRSEFKSFTTQQQAQAWLDAAPDPREMRVQRVDIDLTLDDDDDLNEVRLHERTSTPLAAQASLPSSAPKAYAPASTALPEFIPLDEFPDFGGTSSAVSAGPAKPPQPQAELSPQQQDVLKRVTTDRASVFFTGSAGTGKSVLLRSIIGALGGSACPTLAITASTGIASVNVGGTTLHSWAGIGLGQETVAKLVGKIRGSKKDILNRWRDVETLVIDEISMIDGELFDKLEAMARELRHNQAPFGGIQLILCGDFCQLPPVPERKNGVQQDVRFAFEAQSWHQCVGAPITLTRVFRQKDQLFVDMLNGFRVGRTDQKANKAFQGLRRAVKYEDGIEPTELYPTRREVDNANEMRMKSLSGPTHIYPALDRCGTADDGKRTTVAAMERLLTRLVAPKEIVLKAGAQVMLIKNVSQGHLVNGSVGVVTHFYCPAPPPSDGPNNGSNGQVERPEDEQEAFFDDGPTASSSAPRPSPLQSNVQQPAPQGPAWPVVRFANGQTRIMSPEEFTVNNSHGEVEASRLQVPLILAWAMSVHKSQGQTLERVKIDLGRTFEKGQAYVALSRATNMKTLQVLNFDPSKVKAHPRVMAWLEQRGQTTYDSDVELLESDDDPEEEFFR